MRSGHRFADRAAVGLFATLGLCAQSPPLAPDVLNLAHIRVHMAANLARQPNYTCVETIERFGRSRSSRKFESIDTVKLEVALVGDREMYAWPGAGKFEDTNIGRFVRDGAIGTGYFGMHERSIFLSRAPEFSYKNETRLSGRRVLRYDYRIPLFLSDYHIKVGAREVVVGYHGSFWADAKTLDVLRLDVDADDIPVSLGILEADSRIDYARLRIGAGDFLLPVSSDLTMSDLWGNASRNLMQFASCHEYTGESALLFTEPAPAAAALALMTARPEIEVPAGQVVESELSRQIDSRTAAEGDPVHAVIARDVKRNGAIVIPKGADLTGRLIRLERMGEMFAVSIVFSDVEFPAGRDRFSASLESLGAGARPGAAMIVESNGSRPWGTSAYRSLQPARSAPAPLPDTFYVAGGRVRLPRGFRMVWRTLPPTSQGHAKILPK
ncbi:MAG: hypothetical protein ABI165_01635 [Bryobacteraceae bacterium]